MSETNVMEKERMTGAKAIRFDTNRPGEPFYRGSVQNLYPIPDDDAHMACETTAGGSVFDVGTIFSIENSDLTRSIFRHRVFTDLEKAETIAGLVSWLKSGDAVTSLPAEWLESECIRRATREGIRTHHIGMVDAVSGEVAAEEFPRHPSTFNVVKKFQIIKPEARQLPLGWVYDYEPYKNQDGFVVPLEYIVRLGITSGSSVYRKYLRMAPAEQQAYARRLGVGDELKAWEFFERPIYDLTTKYEPEDRNLENQEALLISTLSGERFAESVLTAILCTTYVAKLLQGLGLRLWDIKWEMARAGDALYLVDTIDTDSLRATYTVEEGDGRFITHFNKQSMRDYYKIAEAEWFAGVNTAKELSGKGGGPFTEILEQGQARGDYPATPDVDPAFLGLQTRKMDLIAKYLTGEEASPRGELEGLAREELEYYRGGGNFEKYCEMNQI